MMTKNDTAHKATDAEIRALENRIRQTYREAYKGAEKSVKRFFKQFEKQDAEYQGLVADGKMSQSDYTTWRLSTIEGGNRYASMRNQLAERYTNANEIAVDYINNDMAKIYSLNRTWTVQNATGVNKYLKGVDFTLYDEPTVRRLIMEQPNLMPHYPQQKALNRGIDLQYGQSQITKSITSGILQGKPIPKIADDLMDRIDTMSRTSAVRTARTAMTEAENAGRQDGAEYLESLGCKIKKQWIATEDNRTRPAHAEADGQIVGLHEPFEVGGELMMHPGDQSMGASGWNIYNCRCTTGDEVTGFESVLPDELQGSVLVE